MDFLKRLLGRTKPANDTPPPAPSSAPRRDITAGDLAARLAQAPAPFLLDVREPGEFTGGHIAGAALIPLGDLERRIGELPRDRPIVCVCQSGSRSSMATRRLAGAGYDAANLTGGMMSWMQAGLPIQRGG